MNKQKHYQALDVLRGFAILLMFIYHFSYDLDYFGFIQQNFSQDPFWLNFRSLIVCLFLSIMGVSLYLSAHKKLNKKRFQKRLAMLLAYSILVSIGSWIMFPKAMIFFGILHFITLASILALLFIRLGKFNLFLGLALIIFANNTAFEFFDQRYLQWFGLTTKLPVTVDYVPFLPWFGVVLIGLYLGQVISSLPENTQILKWQSHKGIFKIFTFAGRNSLHIYMLHQPLFLGILYIISSIIK